ncbi:hypothetical protein [Neorhizobium sp. LjRoot104]
MSTALKKRKQLDQFMSRVMEPLAVGLYGLMAAPRGFHAGRGS